MKKIVIYRTSDDYIVRSEPYFESTPGDDDTWHSLAYSDQAILLYKESKDVVLQLEGIYPISKFHATVIEVGIKND